jgi:hypothetical protein
MTDPALVHEVVHPAGPVTHVLAIGIGHYPHLNGGDGKLTAHNLGMKQLTSPQVSARSIAEWYIRDFDCTDSPLASVALVLSESSPAEFVNPKTGTKYVVPRGTADDVEDAIGRWLNRASNNSENRIVLYFCGHGLSKGIENVYLLRDFGRKEGNAFDGAINYQSFVSALSWCKPTYQFLLFDTCRSSDQILEVNQKAGRSMLTADPAARFQLPKVQQCPLFSTELDRQTFGRANEQTLCAKAFLRSMRGACSRVENDNWYVTTHRMREALTDFQNRELQKGDMKQDADANRHAFIHLRRLPGKPLIPVFVQVDETRLMPDVRLTAIGGMKPPPTISGCQTEEWETALEIGSYDFTAEYLKDATKLPVIKNDVVFPTHCQIKLPVSSWGV